MQGQLSDTPWCFYKTKPVTVHPYTVDDVEKTALGVKVS